MRQPSPPCVQQRLQMQFPARAPLELLRCAVRSPAIGGHGFSARVGVCSEALSSGTRFALLSVRGCYASPGSGGRSIMCATGCVSLATNRYLCRAVGLHFLNRRVALRIFCADTTLAFSGTLLDCCRLAIKWRFVILSHFSLVGVEDARQSLFWQLFVLVASTNSFHRLALSDSWSVHFGVSLMVAVRISAKRESVLFSYRHMFLMYIGK